MKTVHARWLTVTRALVALLVVPLAFAGALPAYAKMAGGEPTHVCRCEVRGGHSTCACPICHPDREDLRVSADAIRGRCGDADIASGTAPEVGIAPAFFAFFAPTSVRTAPPRADVRGPRQIFVDPPTPPPRAAIV